MRKKTAAIFLAMLMAVSGTGITSLAAPDSAEGQINTLAREEISIPKASVMDVDFTSGDAADQSELQNAYRTVGTPTISDSSELHKKIASFNGSSAYLYPFDSSKYEKITDAVTIECMFRYNSLPSGEHDIFSNQQSGGIGLGLDGGKLTFFAHVGGSYRQPTASIQEGQWVHAVGVVDGSSVKLYVNGKLASEIKAQGPVKFTSNANAHNFVIGGDSSASNGAEYFSDADVSFARLYDRALTEEEIRLLDEKAFEGADLPQLKPQQVSMGIVAPDTAAADGEMNVNLHAGGSGAGTVDKITCELVYDPQALTYEEVQHRMSGVTVDDSRAGRLQVTLEGTLSTANFRQYGSTRLGKLNFRVHDLEGVSDTKLQIENFHAYADGVEVTEEMEAVEAAKEVTIYGTDCLDLNGDGVVGAGDIALVDDQEQQRAIAGEAAIYPYKHAVILTMDGGGSVWDPEAIYYTSSNQVTPVKSSDPAILAKRTNTYAMELFNQEFATSYSAQAVVPSISGQNYSSMLHGIPWGDVEAEYQLTNDSSSREYYADFGKEEAKYPSVFQAIAAAAPERHLAAFAEWTNILNGIIEPDAPVIGKASDSKESFYDVAEYIKSEEYQNTALIYMQSDWMDHVGHSTGYYNDTYWSELALYDDYFKAVVDALKETGNYEDTLIIANADHGGSAYNHGSMDPSNMDIFIGLGGQTVDSGRKLEGGDNADIAALALAALRIEKPVSMTGEVFDESAFLSQEQMSRKNRDIEKVTFTRAGKTGTLTLSNPKSQTRVLDAVIDLGGASVKKIDPKGGTILRSEAKDGQLKLTISYEGQQEALAKLTFDQAADEDVKVREVMLGTDQGKEIYPDLTNEQGTWSADKTELDKVISEAEKLDSDQYTAATWSDLQKALAEARAVSGDKLADQEETDAALAALNGALNQLKKLVNRGDLREKIGYALALEKEGYTKETWAVLESALAAARAAAARTDADQSAINQAYEALEKAILGLKKPEPEEETLGEGETFTAGNLRYRVIAGDQAAVTGVKKKSLKSITVPATVTVKGRKLKVTEIGAKAFRGCKKLKRAVLGKNVKTIGKAAFYGDQSLKTIVLRTQKLTSVGKHAFRGISSRAVVRAPKKKVNIYKKLLRKKGLKNSVKVKTLA